MTKTILPCLLIWLCQTGFAQKEDTLVRTDHTYFRLKLENDFFKTRGHTDRYFSNGLRMEYQFPQRWIGVGKIRKMFPTLPGKSWQKTKASLIFGMNMYTPENVALATIDSTDRPYVGWSLIGLSGVSNNFAGAERVTTEISLGVMGPAAGQESVQQFWHRLAKRPDPKGWHNQIRNDIALNVYFNYEKRIFYPVERLEAIGILEVNAGTVSNFAGVGGLVRFGRFNDYYYNASGLKMRNKIYESVENGKETSRFPSNLNRDFQHYFFVKTTFRFALDNSLLEGGFFSYKSSPYVLSGDDLNRFYMNAEFGYALVFKRVGIVFSQLFRSPEFKGANPSHWGALSLVLGMRDR